MALFHVKQSETDMAMRRLFQKLKIWYLKTFKGYYNPLVVMKDGSLYFKCSNGSLRRVSKKKITRLQKATIARRGKIQEYQEFFK